MVLCGSDTGLVLIYVSGRNQSMKREIRENEVVAIER
jgi:hypothetical protein